MSVEFRSVVEQAARVNATGIEVPPSAVAELGGAKTPAVTATLQKAGADPFTYRIKVGTMGGRLLLPLSAANREASGLAAGDEISVTLELDTAPKVMEVPHDLATALTDAGLLDSFVALSYSQQRAHIEPLLAAKAPETRQRRVEKIVATLAAS